MPLISGGGGGGGGLSSTFGHGEVLTDEATTSTTFADLATSGPAATVTVTASGLVLVGWNCQNDVATGSMMSVAVSGATTTAASDLWALYNGNVAALIWGRTYVFTGLAAGSTTFTAKYRSPSGASVGFQRRTLWAIAF